MVAPSPYVVRGGGGADFGMREQECVQHFAKLITVAEDAGFHTLHPCCGCTSLI